VTPKKEISATCGLFVVDKMVKRLSEEKGGKSTRTVKRREQQVLRSAFLYVRLKYDPTSLDIDIRIHREPSGNLLCGPRHTYF